MKHYITILVILLLFCKCSNNDELIIHNDISEFQGIWRDTICDDKRFYVEDFIVKGNSMEYMLTNAETNIIFDKLSGTITLGNENKIGWNCVSPITNMIRIWNWDVLSLSTYQMSLFSKLQGKHDFKRVYNPSIDEFEVSNMLCEILQFMDYLPIHKDDIEKEFGIYNKLKSNNGYVYLINHPFIEKITFMENNYNDSILSYSLLIKNVKSCDSAISSTSAKFREAGEKIEYIDSANISKSKKVIIVDSVSSTIDVIPIKNYNYWPDVSRFIGKPLKEAKDEFDKRYVYDYQEDGDAQSFKYIYRTTRDGIFEYVTFVSDASGIIICCEIEFFNYYNNINEAQKECSLIASILDKRYIFDNYDNNSNSYYYHSGDFVTKSSYSIKLFPKRYTLGMGIYRIQIIYNKI